MSSPAHHPGMSLISVESSFQQRIRKAIWAFAALLLGYAALLPLMLHSQTNGRSIQRLYLILWATNAALLAGIVLFTIRALRRRMRVRIGADGAHLWFDAGNGAVCRYEWHEIFTNRYSLLIGRHRVPLFQSRWRPSATVFPAEFLRNQVLARLPAASYVGGIRLAWIEVSRSRSLYGALVLTFVAAQYLKAHGLPEPLRTAFLAWLTRAP